MSVDSELLKEIAWRAADPATRTDTGLGAPPDVAPRASADLCDAAEASLGFSLPPALRSLYLRVGNGGFGPGYGIVGLAGGHLSSHGESLVELYQVMRADDAGGTQWPARMLLLCDWGCAIWSCVDCAHAEFPVVVSDCADLSRPSERAQHPSACHGSLASWLRAWARGVDLWAEMFPGRTLSKGPIVDPFTGEVLRPARGRPA